MERTREIGVLKALGYMLMICLGMFLSEAVLSRGTRDILGTYLTTLYPIS